MSEKKETDLTTLMEIMTSEHFDDKKDLTIPTPEQHAEINKIILNLYLKKCEQTETKNESDSDDDSYGEINEFMDDFLKTPTDEYFKETMEFIQSLLTKKNTEAIREIVVGKLKGTKFTITF